MEQRRIICDALAIVTCDGSDRILRHADIAIEGQRIQAIGSGLPTDGAEIINASGKLMRS